MEEQQLTEETTKGGWTLYVDRAACASASGAGAILTGLGDIEAKYALRFKFTVTNNAAEYKHLLAGLALAREHEAEALTIYSDSQLVVNQVSRKFKENYRTQTYIEYAQALLCKFEKVTLYQIPRSKNSKADALARLATDHTSSIGKDIPIEKISIPSIDKRYSELFQIQEGSPSWKDEIVAYLGKESSLQHMRK